MCRPQCNLSPHAISVHVGDNAEGWRQGASILSSYLPRTKFILPTAEQHPVGVNGGATMEAWYDISHPIQERKREKCLYIEESRERILALIESEVLNGVPRSGIILVGFSQGGVLSLYTGLQLKDEESLGGIIVLSGYVLQINNKYFPIVNQVTPVYWFHGRKDEIVPYDYAMVDIQHLKKQRAASLLQLTSYDHGHTAR
jgi:lysophospholipase-2